VHVLDRHPEISSFLAEVLGTVRDPDAITPDRRHDGRWRYWRESTGPPRWLFVVVDWRSPDAEIVTAFGRGKVRM
jgi:hypothetical protein